MCEQYRKHGFLIPSGEPTLCLHIFLGIMESCFLSWVPSSCSPPEGWVSHEFRWRFFKAPKSSDVILSASSRILLLWTTLPKATIPQRPQFSSTVLSAGSFHSSSLKRLLTDMFLEVSFPSLSWLSVPSATSSICNFYLDHPSCQSRKEEIKSWFNFFPDSLFVFVDKMIFNIYREFWISILT